MSTEVRPIKIVAELDRAVACGDRAGFKAILGRHPDAPGLLRRVMAGAQRDDEAAAVLAMLDAGLIASIGIAPDGAAGFIEAAARIAAPDQLAELFRDASELKPEDTGLAMLNVRMMLRTGKLVELRRFIDARPVVFEKAENLIGIQEPVVWRDAERARVRAFVADLDSDSPELLKIRAVRWLFLNGEAALAEETAKRLGGDGLGMLGQDGVTRLLRDVPPNASRLQRLDGMDDVQLGISEGDRAIALVFNGLRDQGSLVTGLIDRYFAALGIATLALNDSERLIYLRGIAALGGDRDGTIERLREIIASRGFETVYTLGLSSGGFAAMAYGLALRASASICFSPPSDATSRTADGRAKVVQRRLSEAFGEDERDLLNWFAASDHTLPVTIYYGADNRYDAPQAERLAGIPGIDLRPIENCGSHSAIGEVSRDRSLIEIFAEGFGLEQAAD